MRLYALSEHVTKESEMLHDLHNLLLFFASCYTGSEKEQDLLNKMYKLNAKLQQAHIDTLF